MPPLRASERAQLPDSAFAYIDSKGRRRLPIHDASHVRNALARFGQVHFEDEEARDRARSRLLRAAKKHGIMPIGFINRQLKPARSLPTGQVILSSAVRSAVLDQLPEGITLTSLGEWKFRGLPEPIAVFQVEAPDLDSDFPPLRSAVPAG